MIQLDKCKKNVRLRTVLKGKIMVLLPLSIFIVLCSVIFLPTENFCQSVDVLYNKGLQYYQQGQKGAFSSEVGKNKFKEAAKLFQRVLSKDTNNVNALYYLGKIYEPIILCRETLRPGNFDKCIGYRSKLVSVIEKDTSLHQKIGVPIRKIICDLASTYVSRGNYESSYSNDYERAADIYETALSYEYEKDPNDFLKSQSDEGIFQDIGSCYRWLGRVAKKAKDYSYAKICYNQAQANYKYGMVDFGKEVDEELKICDALSKSREWDPVLYKTVCEEKELQSMDHDIYLYHPKTMEHISKAIVRVWIKSVNIYKDSSSSPKADTKTLYEFDFAQHKCRTLSWTVYDANGTTLSSGNDRDAEWEFIPPDTIAEGFYAFFNAKSRE